MNSARFPGWYPAPINASSQTRKWLQNSGSLTLQIQERCNNFRVEPVFQSYAVACNDELTVLKLRPGELAHVREIYLYCDKTPVLFAHSVLAKKNLLGPWCGISKLGNKSLGTMLFTNPVIKRTPFKFRELNSAHPLFYKACKNMQIVPNTLWARRSLFSLYGKPILVTEVFLPSILELI
ncbi:MAG: chorismate--pyruvate lyase [Nitrosomonadaceae bacterium]|nr:chorismate--pyruvate lyase [Nitrosomonadaceae bacterium]|tara:strand:+ start:3735 stop:4274 length:540 start_codon:yes stop_codon:yes gene_type:complete